MSTNNTPDQIGQILITEEQIQEAVGRLAKRIDASYTDNDKLLALIVMQGAKTFANDLLAKTTIKIETAKIQAQSYHGTTQSHGQVQIPHLPTDKIANRHVLLIDDIYDTGRTLHALQKQIIQHQPRSLRTCVLLEKKIPHHYQINIDFLGLEAPNMFLIGYGLDYQDQYRELPYIANLEINE